jgi:signal transduction histidine kinase
VQDLFFVRLPDFVRTTTFRWTSIAIALSILVFSAFVYWEAGTSMQADMDDSINEASVAVASVAPDRRRTAIDDRLATDPRRIRLAGLFDAGGKRLAGNLRELPPGLVLDGRVHATQATRIDRQGPELMSVRAIGRRLPDGDVLVVARHNGELEEIAAAIGRSLLLGLPVACGLSLAIGSMLSLRVQRRVSELEAQVRRIIDTDLRERLLTANLDHPFDKLAIIANGMLDEIELLVAEMARTGNEIAHDLRTPLTRVRVGLERGRVNATTVAELEAVADRAISGVDEVIAIITCLLRIREIEHYGNRTGFSNVALAGLLCEARDLYEPIAEDKQVGLCVDLDDDAIVRCDRDLLQEAVINLVDNAVKFTPVHGRVRLALVREATHVVIRISDTGPGIGDDERDAVLRRFYRSDKSRQSAGVGLGLSMVSAIARLHGFRLTLSTGPGCVVEIVCPVSER